MRNYQLSVFVLAIAIFLSGCGGASLPADTGESEEAATPIPTQTSIPSTPTEEPTPEPASPTPTAMPQPTPTLTPTAPPTETTLDTAGNPDLNFAQVIFVRATQNSDGRWKFDTTVRHNDEGWDHYADAWQVIDLDDNLLTERILTHPHDTEQPFTRSQSNIEIPADITQVIVRAKCNVHGFGGQVVLVDLTVAEGENFEVVR